jgi:hypothetical protein
MSIKSFFVILTAATIGATAPASPVTFTFQENGLGNLGATSTFTETGLSITAYASSGQTLYAKNGGGDETGLGITSDPSGDWEIYPGTFIQLKGAGVAITSLLLGSVQSGDGDTATIYYSTTLGVLGTLLGTLTSDGTFNIPLADQGGYIGISAGAGNILLDSATGQATVPDAPRTFLLFGFALTALGMMKRKCMA